MPDSRRESQKRRLTKIRPHGLTASRLALSALREPLGERFPAACWSPSRGKEKGDVARLKDDPARPSDRFRGAADFVSRGPVWRRKDWLFIRRRACVGITGGLYLRHKNSSPGDRAGPVATCVGIRRRVFGRHEAIRSCGKVNDVIVRFLGKGLPSVDLAHGDLS